LDYLEFEEKLEIKKILEKYFYSKKDEEGIDLLKGSLDIEKKIIVEDLLKTKEYYYGKRDDKALKFYIGKTIVILEKDKKGVLMTIPLENFEVGINEYLKTVERFGQGHMVHVRKAKEELHELIKKFNNLGKLDKIEKGKILEKIDEILSENKLLGNKATIWEELGISSSEKSMLCKRYNLFREFEEYENFSENQEVMKAIIFITDLNLKEITKKDMSMEEKSKIIESLINREKRN
jgi:hypothetical protein